MYKIDKIKPAIVALVGHRPSAQHALSEELAASASTLFHQDTHPLLSLENIAATISISSGETLSEVLENANSSAAVEVVEAAMQAKKLRGESKSVFRDLVLFEGAGSTSDTEVKTGRLVGFEVRTKNLRHLKAVVQRIGTQFTQTQAQPLKLYVYHSTQPLPLYTVELELGAPYGFKWHDVSGLELMHDSSEYGPGGVFYLCYKESEVEGYAVKHTAYKWGKVPCITCSSYNRMSYAQWSQNLAVTPFYVDESELGAGGEMWQSDKAVQYDLTTNFGLNLSLTVECDISDFVVSNARLFTHAYTLGVAVKLVNRIAYCVENSAISEKLRQRAMYELDNRENGTEGLAKRYKKALEAVDIDLSNLNSRCMPHGKSKSIKTTSIR